MAAVDCRGLSGAPPLKCLHVEIPESTPALNRLRAAAGLIPLIEDGLRQSKITGEKASLMAEFCSWAAQQATEGSPEALRLADDIKSGLERLKALPA